MEVYIKRRSNNSSIVSIIFTIIFTIVIIASIINNDMFRYWISNGTGIVAGQEYRFTPNLETNEDFIQQTFSPVTNGLKSIDIRLANDYPDEVECKLLFSVYDTGERDVPILQKMVSSNEIENWRYYSLELPVELKHKQEYVLEIQCPENTAGIPFKVFICNEKLKENNQLFLNGNLLEEELDLIYNYHTFKTSNFLIFLLLCLTGIVVSWFKETYFKKDLWGYTVLFVSVITCFFLIEYLSGNNVAVRMKLIAVFMNLCILLGILFILLAVTNSSLVAGGVMEGISLTVALINHYTLLFRGTVILPSDIYSVSTAYHVADNYKISIDREIFNTIPVFLLILLFLYKTNFRQKKKMRLATGLLASATASWVAFISTSEVAQNGMDLMVRQDSQTERSQELGFLLNFSENVKYLYIQKPKGYSDAVVKSIYSRYVKEPDSAKKKPNLIVVMNESFTDLRYLGNFDTNIEYMENFYRLAAEKNAKAGKCVVSVYGGGTSCSEFEFLTGCSMMFLPSGNAPYQQFVNTEIDALPAYLKQKEYSAYAIHAANPKSWNRDVSYPRLGFDRFISIEDEVFDKATYCRYWVDDKSMFDEMITLYEESESSLFEFGLTIQCHGGYDYEGYDSVVHIENMQSDYPEVEQYLSLIREVDQAFGAFVDTLRNSNNPVIVVMFGDHLPQLSNEFYDELKEGIDDIGEAELQLERYETPYLFWANYDIDFSEIPDILSANFLSLYMLKAGGIGLDSYYNYLYELSGKYPVISRAGILNSGGEFCEYIVGDDCYEDILEYEMLQYNLLKKNNE